MAAVTRYVNTNSTPGGDGTTNGTSGATRAYASLAEAESAMQGSYSDLVEIVCSGTVADAQCTIDGWTITGSGYLLVRGASTSSGKWDTSKYRIESTDSHALFIKESPSRFRDLQVGIKTESDSPLYCMQFYSGIASGEAVYVERCIFRNITATTGVRSGIYWYTSDGTYNIGNNVFYDMVGNNSSSGLRISDSLTAYIYHNTFCNCRYGVYAPSSPANVRLKNNIFQDNVYSLYNNSGSNFNSASNYNVADDAGTGNYLIPGANNTLSTEITFVDEAGDDFHVNDANAKVANNLYSDSSYAITVDIDNQSRPSSGNVYAGADEVISSDVTGTSGQTQDEAVQSAAGTLTNTGTSAQTGDEALQAGAGSVAFIGTATQTADDASQSVTGTVSNTGTIANTIDEVNQTLAGALTVTGTLTNAVDEAQQSISGAITNEGVIGSNQDEAAQTVAGGLTVTGAITSQNDESIQSASAELAVIGTSSQVINHTITTIISELVNTGEAAQTAEIPTQEAIGSIPLPVDGTITQNADTANQSIAGEVLNSGEASQAIAHAVQSASGSVGNAAVDGTITSSTDADTQAAIGSVVVVGQLAQVGDATAQAGTGKISVDGVADQEIDTTTQTVAGLVSIEGTSQQVFDAAYQSAVGAFEILGTASQTADDNSQNAVGAVVIHGAIVQASESARQAMIDRIYMAMYTTNVEKNFSQSVAKQFITIVGD